MELKDMVLSTLAELEEETEKSKEVVEQSEETVSKEPSKEREKVKTLDDERYFCESMRERILVLFEGFQSPNNKSIEAKIDLTLNFLEYSLAVLDERLEKLDNR